MADALSRSAAVSHGMMLAWAEDDHCPICKHGEVETLTTNDDGDQDGMQCECGAAWSVQREVRTVSINVDGEEITDEFSQNASDFKRQRDQWEDAHTKLRRTHNQLHRVLRESNEKLKLRTDQLAMVRRSLGTLKLDLENAGELLKTDQARIDVIETAIKEATT